MLWGGCFSCLLSVFCLLICCLDICFAFKEKKKKIHEFSWVGRLGGVFPCSCLLDGDTGNNQLGPLRTWKIQCVGRKRVSWSAKGCHMKRKRHGQLSSSIQTMNPNRDKFNRTTWVKVPESDSIRQENTCKRFTFVRMKHSCLSILKSLMIKAIEKLLWALPVG